MPFAGRFVLLLAAAGGFFVLSNISAAQQELDEIDKLLQSLPFDKDWMAEQAGESLPASGMPSAGDCGPGDDAQFTKCAQAPDDYAPKVRLAPAVSGKGLPRAQFKPAAGPVALVLPLDARGLIGQAAQAFYDGFNRAAQVEGKSLPIELFSTDGSPASAVAAYRQAVRIGSSRIIGPLLRSAVGRVALLPPEEKAPSLLLQMPEGGALLPQFAYPLGAESEIIQFIRLAAASPAPVQLLVEPSVLGRRIADAMGRHWSGRARRPVRNDVLDESVWMQIHDGLRTQLESGSADSVPPLVFAAGSSAFAHRARAHVPSALPVYVLSAVYADTAADTAGMRRDGLRFFETPWLATPHASTVANYDSPEIRERPAELQRYYAAGIDAFALAGASGLGGRSEEWRMQGVTGLIELKEGSFLRSGVLVELRGGHLKTINGVL